jgi:hypothetical protein
MTGGELSSASRPFRVILAPDVVGGLWFDADCATVFEAWRDERLRPAVNRDLLMRYARLWRAIGLPELQIRRWSWWFTSPATGQFVPDETPEDSSPIECCSRLAIVIGASCVVHRGAIRAPEATVRWLAAADFLRSLA